MSVYNKVGNNEIITFKQDIQSMLLFMMNGKYGGGGMPLTPACLMNDGLMDIIWYNDILQAHKFVPFLNKMLINQGLHVYDPTCISVRGTKMVLENLNYEETNDVINTNPQLKV